MSEAPLSFPLLAFMPSFGSWAEDGAEPFEWYVSEHPFTHMSAGEIKAGDRVGMLVIDQTGRNWRVLSVTDLGPDGEGVWKLLSRLLGNRRVTYEMVEETPTLPFETIRERVCASIQASPDVWRDDEAIAGESGEPRDEQEMLDELTAKARAAASLLELIAVLDFRGRD